MAIRVARSHHPTAPFDHGHAHRTLREARPHGDDAALMAQGHRREDRGVR
ncbi:hypothetical protein ACFYO1_15420 [Nocardia sp. NPDC006044]